MEFYMKKNGIFAIGVLAVVFASPVFATSTGKTASPKPPADLAAMTSPERSVICGLHMSALAGQSLAVKSPSNVSLFMFMLARYWRNEASSVDVRRASSLDAQWQRYSTTTREAHSRYCLESAANVVTKLPRVEVEALKRVAESDMDIALRRAEGSREFSRP